MFIEEDFVEAIKNGEIVKISRRQAVKEELFILRKVKEEKEAEKEKDGFLNDVSNISGKPRSLLESWKKKEFNYENNNVINDLISNFHWEIVQARRNRNMTRKQLAEEIKFSEDDLKMIEFGQLPKDDFILINKLENFLKINLKKVKSNEQITSLSDLQKKKEKEEALKDSSKKDDFFGNEIEIDFK
ncbi:TPA: hypothetical protein EYQ19_01855 [Candidatus Pacearchaeota archaeon]|nr:hypothetical protein [Candidatus Pacearchaeota archaeon]